MGTPLEAFRRDVIDGLSMERKTLPCKYFYDQRGSQLFDAICELDEYYVTRTEQAIMRQYVDEMATQIGPDVMLIELGSGSSLKTRALLDALQTPTAYVPLDISSEHLLETADDLRIAYPNIEILPVVADFTKSFALPTPRHPYSHAALYFPGSTIGNFTPEVAQGLLASFSQLLGPQGGLLIGIDLKKDPEIIRAAYNDREGVTGAFNLNLLHRINDELGGDFEVDKFHHEAVYDAEAGRIEMLIISDIDQTVTVGDHQFSFTEGETILTEHSHKYTVDEFSAIAESAQFSLHKHWIDDRQMFAVLHLVNERE